MTSMHMEVEAFFGRFVWRGINNYDVTIHPSRGSRINTTLKVCEHNRAAHASAGLSFLIVNLGVPWALWPNSPVLLRRCPKCLLFFFFRRELPHKNGATSEVVPSLKGYYLSSTSFLTKLSGSNFI